MTDLVALQQQAAAYRAQTFRYDRKHWLKNEQDALHFVEECGFVFFWPIKNLEMPSLWKATVGDRPVPNNHDDPGHITWRWKDELVDKRVWYYAKLIRKKSTIVSLAMAPYFYTLSPNFGDYENDYLVDYKNGLMSMESKNVYEALLRNGPLHTLDLRKEAHLTATDKKYRFDKALSDLQADMKILPVGIAVAGRWGYAMIYDITARYHPQIVEKARYLTEEKAQQTILLAYLRSVGLAEENAVTRLFAWKKSYLSKAARNLQEKGKISILPVADPDKSYYVLQEIFHLQ